MKRLTINVFAPLLFFRSSGTNAQQLCLRALILADAHVAVLVGILLQARTEAQKSAAIELEKVRGILLISCLRLGFLWHH